MPGISEELLATVERIVRITATVLAAYFVALWIAAIWWTFRDIRTACPLESLIGSKPARSIARA